MLDDVAREAAALLTRLGAPPVRTVAPQGAGVWLWVGSIAAERGRLTVRGGVTVRASSVTDVHKAASQVFRAAMQGNMHPTLYTGEESEGVAVCHVEFVWSRLAIEWDE